MTERRIAFLMYHELEAPGFSLRNADRGYIRYIVRVADFSAQMQFLKGQEWRGLSVGEAIGFPDEKAVAVTFDDGSETDLIRAAPVLKAMDFSATFYITNSWLGQRGHLSHSQLRELCSLGFEIGCHSMTHAYLTDIDENGLHREIVEAKARLEQIIGTAVEHFSCPGGRFDWRVARVASQAGYITVSTSQIRANARSTDRFALGRVPVMRSTSLPEFQNICRGQGFWRSKASLQLREAGRRLLGNSIYDRLRNALLRYGVSG